MKKTIQRLRDQKAAAVGSMDALNAKVQAEKRDFTTDEQAAWDGFKATADSAALSIAELEATQPAPVPESTPEKIDGVATERMRQKSIRDRVSAAKLPETLAAELCDSGASLEDATTRVFAELARTEKPAPKPHAGSMTQTVDERDTLRGEMAAALLYRIDPRGNPLKEGFGRRFSGRKLVELAEKSLQAVGANTDLLTREEIVNYALSGQPGNTAYLAAGMHSSSDFPNILADVANKRMRMAYMAAPRTFTGFAKQVTATDFKNINAIQVSDMSPMTKVNEHGEFKSFTLNDSKETYKLETYGGICRITRKTIINDDMRVLDELPRMIGTAGARLENETVWGIITANAAMSDTVAIFHATHANLLTGGGSALAISGLGAARAQMRKQTAPKGQVLNITAAYIAVPAALETTALQLVVPNSLAASQVSNIVPDWIRTLVPVVEPLLDANSATAWYLFGDPGVVCSIEYCYLEGQEGVYTETRNGFEVDGIEIKGRVDFGAQAVEYRGLQKNAGV